MLGVGHCVILTKKNVCKSLVEPRCVILARFSIFSIQLRFIVPVLVVVVVSAITCTVLVQYEYKYFLYSFDSFIFAFTYHTEVLLSTVLMNSYS